ncbi:MAG: hypothetical protein ABI678_30115 [Kofleriaceae bacterium]
MSSEFADHTPQGKRSRKRRELEYLAALIAVDAERNPNEDVEKTFIMLTRS